MVISMQDGMPASPSQLLPTFHPPPLPYLQLIDPKTKEEKAVVISEDDGIRGSTTMESLSKLPTIFKRNGGTTTAGNASQVQRGREWESEGGWQGGTEPPPRPVADHRGGDDGKGDRGEGGRQAGRQADDHREIMSKTGHAGPKCD